MPSDRRLPLTPAQRRSARVVLGCMTVALASTWWRPDWGQQTISSAPLAPSATPVIDARATAPETAPPPEAADLAFQSWNLVHGGARPIPAVPVSIPEPAGSTATAPGETDAAP